MTTDTPKTNAQIIELKCTQRGYTVSQPSIEEASLVPADFARELERENTRLRAAASRLDRYLSGCEIYEHGVIEGNGNDNSLTPAKLVRSILANK